VNQKHYGDHQNNNPRGYEEVPEDQTTHPGKSWAEDSLGCG